MSHTATDEWQSFETRMRHRRAERCRLRAEVAIQEGCTEDAAAMLAEARKLEPDSPENARVEQLISAGSADAGQPVGRRGRARWIAAAAILLIGSAAAVEVMRVTRAREDAAARVAPAVSDAGSQAQASAGDVRPISTLTVARPMGAADPSVVEGIPLVGEDVLPAATEPPAAVAGAGVSSQPADEPPLPSSVSLQPVSGPPQPEAVPDREAPAPPPPPIRALAEPPAVASPARIPGEEAHVSAPLVHDETKKILSVLSKYEAAYSALDAGAAGEVWPGVDMRALARAFEGLESQRVSLGDCNVTITGVTAHAECSGSTTWTPKVGAGRRTQPHSWSFDLARRNDGWLIHSANIK